MKNYVTEQTISKGRKRRGYLIPIEGFELKGPISRGFKYVRIREWDNSKDRLPHSSLYFKKVRVLACSYCGEESSFTAIFPHSGYETIERLCPKCVKVYGPIPEAEPATQKEVPVCNLL